MKRTFTFIFFIFIIISFLACTKERSSKSEAKPEAKQTAEKTQEPRKIMTQLAYQITNPAKEYLSTKTDYDQTGKKIKETYYSDDGKVTETINYDYDNKGLMTKVNLKRSDFDEETMQYTIANKYDDKGRLISEKYSGDYATDVSPDYFEYVYTDSDKPVEKNHYVTIMPDNPRDLIYKETYKYDSKGNKVEEVLKGITFDYLEKSTFEYDDNNQLIRSTRDNGEGPVSKFRYEYEYY
jgi:hypothetical protein